MYEEFFPFIWDGIFGTFATIEQKERRKEKDIPDDELDAYIKHPEETLKTLMAQREVFSKEKDVGKLGAIDAQIKGLELICKIPGPVRPAALRIMKKGLHSIEGMVDGI